MANDNQGSRAFLAIVLGGIVLALVIAAYFMYGHKGDTNVKVRAADIRAARRNASRAGSDAARRRGAGRASC